MKKPNRKFKDRKTKIKQYRTDTTLAIRELVKETLLEAGWKEAHAKRVSFEAGREETKYIVETTKNLIAEHQLNANVLGDSVAVTTSRFPV